jgi:hypothetical protein
MSRLKLLIETMSKIEILGHQPYRHVGFRTVSTPKVSIETMSRQIETSVNNQIRSYTAIVTIFNICRLPI